MTPIAMLVMQALVFVTGFSGSWTPRYDYGRQTPDARRPTPDAPTPDPIAAWPDTDQAVTADLESEPVVVRGP